MVKLISKVLEEEWKKLIDIKEKGGEPKTIFQRNFFYRCRTITTRKYGKSHICNYAYFKYELIYKFEGRFGYSREELGIRAKPDATISTRYGLELINYEHKLIPVICIIATEKSGIAESLAEHLTKYGIYIITFSYIALIGIMVWLLFDKWVDLAQATAASVDTAAVVLDRIDQILGSMDNICSGGSGLVPQ